MNHYLTTEFTRSDGKKCSFYSLHQLEQHGFKNIKSLPFSLRIILESLLRNFDGLKIKNDHISALCNWEANEVREQELPFVVSRVILQDYTGLPLLVDLAAMRDVVNHLGNDPRIIEPLVPVDLIIDHSVNTNHVGSSNALKLNMELEFEKNEERFTFMQWGGQAFSKVNVIPAGQGIIHQINLERIAIGVIENNGICYPDTVVGTDSHTTMINGIGVVGWGVGGIEAESVMLGCPVYILIPDVIGVKLSGFLVEGVTATDLVLTITQVLRCEKVVGKIVEYFGAGVSNLSVPDRATIANMAPDYGATMGYFPIDEKTLEYYKMTGRPDSSIELIETYFRLQGMFGIPQNDEIRYTKVLHLDLGSIRPCVAGPNRPQDKILLSELKNTVSNMISVTNEKLNNIPNSNPKIVGKVKHGDIVIAGIASCTNTSNPNLLIAAGLLAKKAYQYGLKVNSKVKTSLTPGSRVVTEYLRNAGLLEYLELLGFWVSAYGCATCIGNVGDLNDEIEQDIRKNDVIAVSVLSGNRNFEARIHNAVKANFLMSPPLVVVFALAGTVDINLDIDPIGFGHDMQKIFLRDIWPSSEEVNQYLYYAMDPAVYKNVYGSNQCQSNNQQNSNDSNLNCMLEWEANSSYITKPPFFENFSMNVFGAKTIKNARILAIFGDSISTDHISPVGEIYADSPAGMFLKGCGVMEADFNNYGTRRGNHEVMVRGTFSNPELNNLMLKQRGGWTVYYPNETITTIYDAAMTYQKNKINTIIFAGEEYGTGSARDWAAKGTMLLGVGAVVAKSFERIHRSNLVGMGIIPLQFAESDSVQKLSLVGSELINFENLDNLSTGKTVSMIIKKNCGEIIRVELLLRLDTEIEVEYIVHGGILPYTLRAIINNKNLNIK